MNLSLWGIRHPLPAVMVFIVLCVAGFYGLRQLPISQLPDVQLPEVRITINLPGATPSQLETDVTRRVEDAVASLTGIDKLNSTVSEGSSVTRVQFRLGRDMRDALDEVRDAVTRIRNELPNDIDEPIIARQNLIGATLLSYAIRSDRMAPDELSWFIDDTITKEVFGVPGVGSVTRSGGVDREIRVALKPEVLQAYGVTATSISQQLARLQLEKPGGRTTAGGAEQSVRTIATVRTAAELGEYPMFLPDGRSVRLSALATVTDGAGTPHEAALLNGEPVIGMYVGRSRGTSEVGVGNAVRKKLAALQAATPGLQIIEVSSSVETAEASYDASISMLWEGALLAVIVVWWFLRDWRATWISAVALPLSIMPTFAVMHWLDFSLNLLTLLALAVVIGVLVDDAIVEVENVARHRAMGKTPMQAAIDASNEIGIAVVATSTTLAAVFLPVAFLPGVVGKFFREFGWTAAAAVLFSLLVARLLTPMLAAYFMKNEPRHAEDTPLLNWYLVWVRRALANRGWTITLALLIFVASLILARFIPKTFVPSPDSPRTQLEVELPPGARLEDTIRATERIRLKLKALPEFVGAFTRVGSANSGSGGGAEVFAPEVRKAAMVLQFREDRKHTMAQLEAQIRDLLREEAGVRLGFTAQGPGDRLELVLAGRDPAALAIAAHNLTDALRSLPGLGSVTSSAALLRPEVIIRPDPARAADLGVSTLEIADAARIATSGDFRQKLAKLNLAERQIPIRVQLADEALDNPALLAQLRVSGKNGPVPLSAVATISEGSGPATISRLDRERTVRLSVELNGQPLGDTQAKLKKLPAMNNLPAGVRVLPAGDAEAFVVLITGFALALLTGVLSVYAVLLLLFNSAIQPLTILVAIPLCGGGAFGMLLLTHNALSVPSLIGLILLTGIATKNSILIVDYAIIGERDLGLSRYDAVLDACRKRARPVVMTSIAMGAGMLPIALGLGSDGSFRQPLGVAVLGGLLTSTVLSLVVVPVVYMSAARLIDLLRKRRAQRRGQPIAPDASRASSEASRSGVPMSNHRPS